MQINTRPRRFLSASLALLLVLQGSVAPVWALRESQEDTASQEIATALRGAQGGLEESSLSVDQRKRLNRFVSQLIQKSRWRESDRRTSGRVIDAVREWTWDYTPEEITQAVRRYFSRRAAGARRSVLRWSLAGALGLVVTPQLISGAPIFPRDGAIVRPVAAPAASSAPAPIVLRQTPEKIPGQEIRLLLLSLETLQAQAGNVDAPDRLLRLLLPAEQLPGAWRELSDDQKEQVARTLSNSQVNEAMVWEKVGDRLRADGFKFREQEIASLLSDLRTKPYRGMFAVLQDGRQITLPWQWVVAQMLKESNLDPTAVSPRDGHGLMQVNRDTLTDPLFWALLRDRYGLVEGESGDYSPEQLSAILLDPTRNVQIGILYAYELMARLHHRIDRQEDRLKMAMFAYNRGPSWVFGVSDARVGSLVGGAIESARLAGENLLTYGSIIRHAQDPFAVYLKKDGKPELFQMTDEDLGIGNDYLQTISATVQVLESIASSPKSGLEESIRDLRLFFTLKQADRIFREGMWVSPLALNRPNPPTAQILTRLVTPQLETAHRQYGSLIGPDQTGPGRIAKVELEVDLQRERTDESFSLGENGEIDLHAHVWFKNRLLGTRHCGLLYRIRRWDFDNFLKGDDNAVAFGDIRAESLGIPMFVGVEGVVPAEAIETLSSGLKNAIRERIKESPDTAKLFHEAGRGEIPLKHITVRVINPPEQAGISIMLENQGNEDSVFAYFGEEIKLDRSRYQWSPDAAKWHNPPGLLWDSAGLEEELPEINLVQRQEGRPVVLVTLPVGQPVIESLKALPITLYVSTDEAEPIADNQDRYNEDDLAEALRARPETVYVTDVTRNELLEGQQPLAQLAGSGQMLVTAHTASNARRVDDSLRVRDRMGLTAAENLRAVLVGDAPPNPVFVPAPQQTGMEEMEGGRRARIKENRKLLGQFAAKIQELRQSYEVGRLSRSVASMGQPGFSHSLPRKREEVLWADFITFRTVAGHEWTVWAEEAEDHAGVVFRVVHLRARKDYSGADLFATAYPPTLVKSAEDIDRIFGEAMTALQLAGMEERPTDELTRKTVDIVEGEYQSVLAGLPIRIDLDLSKEVALIQGAGGRIGIHAHAYRYVEEKGFGFPMTGFVFWFSEDGQSGSQFDEVWAELPDETHMVELNGLIAAEALQWLKGLAEEFMVRRESVILKALSQTPSLIAVRALKEEERGLWLIETPEESEGHSAIENRSDVVEYLQGPMQILPRLPVFDQEDQVEIASVMKELANWEAEEAGGAWQMIGPAAFAQEPRLREVLLQLPTPIAARLAVLTEDKEVRAAVQGVGGVAESNLAALIEALSERGASSVQYYANFDEYGQLRQLANSFEVYRFPLSDVTWSGFWRFLEQLKANLQGVDVRDLTARQTEEIQQLAVLLRSA